MRLFDRKSGRVHAAGLVESALCGAERGGSEQTSAGWTDHCSGSDTPSRRSDSIVTLPQRPHADDIATRLRPTPESRSVASAVSTTLMRLASAGSSGHEGVSATSAMPSMTPSERRKPSVSASSSPGVRMMTANASPFTRTSSGASTATRSVRARLPPGAKAVS